MLLIGLTGGIASGKTLVSDRFAHHGVPVIDADLLAREVVRKGNDGLHELIAYFGTAILTQKGDLDRTKLRELIFANPPDRKVVDDLLHPRIRALANQRIDAARSAGHAYAVYAVPLLVETGQAEHFDRVVVVDIPAELQLARLLVRDGTNVEQAQSILAAQATRDERLAVADDVVDNSGAIEATLARVDALHTTYLDCSRS